MPLLSVEYISEDVCLALWKLSETAEDLFISYPFLSSQADIKDCMSKSSQRNAERLAERLLIKDLFDESVTLLHEESGRPLLSNGCNISISHTKGFVAVITSKTHTVSIDTEYMSDRVNRIADRFLRSDEYAEDVFTRLLHWCSKETLYKFYSSDKLEFKDMRLLSIHGTNDGGRVVAENLKRGESLDVYYRILDNILLTYSFA